jgi:hypothetical protein
MLSPVVTMARTSYCSNASCIACATSYWRRVEVERSMPVP